MASSIFKAGFLALATLTQAVPALAHELWIEAEDWHVAPGEMIRADVRNGVDLVGPEFSWYDKIISRAELTTPEGSEPFQGAPGDLPAIQYEAVTPGLNVLVYESTVSSLTYKSFELFEEFAEEKGLNAELQVHLDEGLPKEHLRELFTRHLKALFSVGDGAGEDQLSGMNHELLAETNPYTLPEGEDMRVRLFYEGKPSSDVRITVFRRDGDGEVSKELYQTDADGRIAFPLEPNSTYLVDNVHLRRTTRQELVQNTAFWLSSWAALTFGTDS